MPLIETAVSYILGIITENEEVKKFPKEFVTESAKWVKSWFLKPEDPKTMAKLSDTTKSYDYKKAVIETKLEDLHDNPQFMRELEEKLKIYESHKLKTHNTIDDSELDVKGSFHQGDKGNLSGNDVDEKNRIKRSKITVGGDFRQGDDIQQGNTIVNNHYYGPPPTNKTSAPTAGIKTELKNLLAKGDIGVVIERLLDLTENQDKKSHDTVLLLSGRLNRLNNTEMIGIIDYSEAMIQRNQLSNALINVIAGLE